MAQFSPESWLNSNRNGGSRRSDRWLKIARNIHFQIIETDRSFTYDADGKLTSILENEERQGETKYEFRYDAMGNRTYYGKTVRGTLTESTETTYNAANQPVSAVEFDGKHSYDVLYHYDEDGNLIEEERGKNGNLKVEKTYTYWVENRLQAVYDTHDVLMAAAYDGDGNRVFQLNYNLHTDNDWKGNSGNGNGNNKDNKGQGNSGNGNTNPGNGSSSGNNGNSGKGNGKNGKTNTNNGNGGNGNHYGWGNGSSSSAGNGNNGNGNNGNGNNKTGGADPAVSDNNGSAYGNTNNTGGSQNRSGILFPESGKVSSIEQELIDLIRTTGKEKNYELIEYVNDVNRQYAEVLMELNENGYTDTAYSYGNKRLSADRFEGSSYYYLYEGRGSVSAVTGTDGYFTASYRYNAYGEMTLGKPQYENVYGYNGESYNPNLNGQYLRARYYHVETVNFFTEDSYLGNIREPLSLNRYNYVYSSYLNHVDPSGNRLDDDVVSYRQFTNELNYVQNSKSYQKMLDALGRGFSYLARKVEQAQGKAVSLTCNISKSAKQAIDQVNWSRVAQGSVQAFLAASVVAVGVTATVATGGLAGAAIAGIAAGSGVSTVGVAAIGTFMAGSAVTVMGAADVLEGGTDIFHGFRGSDEESVHLIRDNIQYFRDNPDSYYLLEAMLGTAANAGTTALSPFIVKNDGQDNGYDEDTYGLPYQAGRGVSRGGQHEPTDLREKLAMEEVMSNPKKGMRLEEKNTDPRWPVSEGWEKWVQNVNGIEIHYQYNPLTGEFDDVKIK